MTRIPRRRRGMTLVETAICLSAAFLLIFGIFEYSRFVLMKTALENSAREGARFAVVHTNDKTTQDVKDAVTVKLAGLDAKLANFAVTVRGVVLRDGPNGPAGTVLASWDNASPTDGIEVEVSGDYNPVLASFVGLPEVMTLRAKATMYSEAN
jgi:Flp pilus assembly protein TadG